MIQRTGPLPTSFGAGVLSVASAPTQLNGVPIAQLERDMRPGALSTSGFLGPKEDLLAVLAEDAARVAALGLTHEAIAAALQTLMAAGGRGQARVMLAGEAYEVLAMMTFGTQESPFRDGTLGSKDFAVTRLATGASVMFSELLPTMIARYGFYEGHGTPYRVGPDQLLAVIAPLLRAEK